MIGSGSDLAHLHTPSHRETASGPSDGGGRRVADVQPTTVSRVWFQWHGPDNVPTPIAELEQLDVHRRELEAQIREWQVGYYINWAQGLPQGPLPPALALAQTRPGLAPRSFTHPQPTAIHLLTPERAPAPPYSAWKSERAMGPSADPALTAPATTLGRAWRHYWMCQDKGRWTVVNQPLACHTWNSLFQRNAPLWIRREGSWLVILPGWSTPCGITH